MLVLEFVVNFKFCHLVCCESLTLITEHVIPEGIVNGRYARASPFGKIPHAIVNGGQVALNMPGMVAKLDLFDSWTASKNDDRSRLYFLMAMMAPDARDRFSIISRRHCMCRTPEPVS